MYNKARDINREVTFIKGDEMQWAFSFIGFIGLGASFIIILLISWRGVLNPEPLWWKCLFYYYFSKCVTWGFEPRTSLTETNPKPNRPPPTSVLWNHISFGILFSHLNRCSNFGVKMSPFSHHLLILFTHNMRKYL